MKRVLSVFFLVITATLFVVPSASATNIITITEPTHRQLDGAFIDDELATLISYDGVLGKKIFAPLSSPRIWQIDPALVEEVQAMSAPYLLADGTEGVGTTAAQIWLARLKSVTRNDHIVAMPYGNPSGYWIHKLSPHDESYFLTVGAEKLQTILNRPISVSIAFTNNSKFHLNSLVYQSFVDGKKIINAAASFMSGDDLEKYRLRSASVLNPDLTTPRRDYLARDTTATTYALSHKIRLSSSKFTVTSERQNLPITVINDFIGEAKLKIYVEGANSRITTPSAPVDLTLPGKSKVQIKIPVQVITPGQSALMITIRNAQGAVLSEPTNFPLTLSVISPVATWFTTGAAIVLFVAAIVQSARRIRKARK